ncbi:CBS domain-containing protein [Roseomonas stagni]|uniref:CBS domain-containing protein n=1 Tax=Falsiroseomonas algicola TaxID=2716930 RepID=A0A6M1LLI0_9PROT|nr:CBS domain-containing protein [Falsiroseomonas algicola]NGM20962.1 CBS domain-containing protein [Falsiroseomonas algicola]
MRAKDLMTTTVVTVAPEARLADVAHLLADRGISAVPVLGPGGEVQGIVTEADLVRQLASEPAGRPRGWFRALLTQRAADTAKGFARLHGQRARDVMTTELVAVEEDTPSEQIAQLMEERGVKRVPVLRDGKLVGVVSRADLLGLAFGTAAPPDVAVSDARLLRDVERAMREQPWADAYLVFPSVEDGVVTFHGWCRSPDVPRALRVLAESLPGVKDVQMDLREPPGFLLGVP